MGEYFTALRKLENAIQDDMDNTPLEELEAAADILKRIS
jgi:hypothetical protein